MYLLVLMGLLLTFYMICDWCDVGIKSPSKNSLISKMIRYPVWMTGCKDTVDLPKTSCGYIIAGVLLGLLNVIVFFFIITLTLTTLGITYNLWLGEILNLVPIITSKEEPLHMVIYLELFNNDFLPALFFGAGVYLGFPLGLLALPAITIYGTYLLCKYMKITYHVGKGLEALFKSNFTVKIGKGILVILKPVGKALKSLHKQFCVPMKYKD